MEIALDPVRPDVRREGPDDVPFWDETHAAVSQGGAHRGWYVTADGDVIGLIGASDCGEGRHQVGYGIAPSHEGRAAGTAALRALVEALRAEGASVAVGETFDDHVASRRVMEKVGLQLVVEKREVVDGEERDLVVYEVSLR